jgi:transcriptional regulator with XRE-family HTH domain
MMDVSAREKIRAARTAQGLSLRELARRIGVSASLLSRVRLVSRHIGERGTSAFCRVCG